MSYDEEFESVRDAARAAKCSVVVSREPLRSFMDGVPPRPGFLYQIELLKSPASGVVSAISFESEWVQKFGSGFIAEQVARLGT